MGSLAKGQSTRYYFRKGVRPYCRTRCVPALSTQEAAALVMGVIEARLEDGWPLERIAWRQYCRDQAVVNSVCQQIAQHATESEET